MSSLATRHPANPQLMHVGINTLGRDFAVGDIHGSFSALQRALDRIGFVPGQDRLFSVGDLVDRGPESDQVLDWLDRPWFHAICGNHDFMVWRTALGDPFPDVNFLDHGGTWFKALAPAQQRQVGERLAALPLAMEVQTPQGLVGMVHADCPCDDWLDMQNRPLSANAQDYCLWSRKRIQRGDTSPVRNVRAVIHGHTTLARMHTLGNVFFIDTGGWRTGHGHFTLVELHTLKAWQVPA